MIKFDPSASQSSVIKPQGRRMSAPLESRMAYREEFRPAAFADRKQDRVKEEEHPEAARWAAFPVA